MLVFKYEGYSESNNGYGMAMAAWAATHAVAITILNCTVPKRSQLSEQPL